MREAKWRAIVAALRDMEAPARRRLMAGLPAPAFRGFAEEWRWQTLKGQREPPGDWRVWLALCGRGYGKTRVGAEWVWARAREAPDARIALVGGSLDEVARVMIEGESGLLATARSDEAPVWRPSRREILFPSGAIGQVYSGADPAKLRGPQHHFAWCDELAKWRHPAATWANLRMGLRLGERPRIVVTTTPAPVAALKAIVAAADTARTHGRTGDNPHSAGDYRAAMREHYAGTRLGRQELDGVLFDDVLGALWTRGLIEESRTSARPEDMARVVVGVDPPASADGDACGIVVCGQSEDGTIYVLADCSAAGLSPNGWARKVANAADRWRADRIIAEKNNGGDMVGSTLTGAGLTLPVRLVSASRGKAARAEPIAGRFEAGRAKFAGCFPELEDELCAMTCGGGYQGPGSPDRADAMVWAMTELIKPRVTPRIVRL